MQSRIRPIPASYQNPEKICDSQTFHNKAITYREMNLEKSPLSKLGLCSQTQTHPTEPQDNSTSRPNQIIRKQEHNYLPHWKELTKKQRKLECYLALTMYKFSEHSLAIEKGRRRQTWLSREDRLCAHCPQNEVETELYFLTSCQMYDHIRDTYFPQIKHRHTKNLKTNHF